MTKEQRNLEIALNCYLSDIPDNRKELVREKLIASEWIPYKEHKPPYGTRILTKIREGDFFVEWFDGRRGDGILEITHWKPLIK